MKKKKIISRLKNLIKKIILATDAGSTLETGLIWALVIVLFLLLVGWITDLYSWIETKFSELFNLGL